MIKYSNFHQTFLKAFQLLKLVHIIKMNEKLSKLEKEVQILDEDLLTVNDEIRLEINELKEKLEDITERVTQLEIGNKKEIIYPYPIEESTDADYEPLINFPDYEISKKYNYPIRKIRTKHIVHEWLDGNYIYVQLNNKRRAKHKLVAQQWIPNDDPKHKKQVDHTEINPFDYRVDHLRWVTQSQNCLNKGGMNHKKFEFVDLNPAHCCPVKYYNGHEFDNLYYDGSFLYLHTGLRYRKVKPNTKGYVQIKNKKKKYAIFSFRKFENEFTYENELSLLPIDFEIFDLV